jgi:hypothetical protein
MSQALWVRNHLTWDDLLKNSRTVILSEAGSGKTQEIKHAALNLREEGKAAFFLRLELIAHEFELAFEVGTPEAFERWIVSTDDGWLLLDSVDEARLRGFDDFERAIRNIGKLIVPAKDRVNIVLTGRTYAWRAKSDLDFCQQHLGCVRQQKRVVSEPLQPNVVPDDSLEDGDELDITDEQSQLQTHESVEDEPSFKIVALDTLTKEQIAKFANARGVVDSSQLLDEIERADAWSFTSRPQDLQEVIDFWKTEKRIGTRLDLMRRSIERRLTERDERRGQAMPIAPSAAREGAKLAAAAVTLTQTPVIRVPDGADNSKGIPLAAVLPDWDKRLQNALLSFPIFDQIIYGTVRFHFRPVLDYLAAEWFNGFLAKPVSRRSVEALFFQEKYGQQVIVPAMRPVLLWLAILNSHVLERARGIAPELIFEGGDPSALPLIVRRSILAEVCEMMADDQSLRDGTTDYSAVQRFSNPDIATDIRQLMEKYAAHDSVVGFLVRMIWLGRLAVLTQEAKCIALNPNASTYTRIAAFRAIRALGQPQDQDDLRDAFLAESNSLKRDWLGELLRDLESTPSTNTWLLAALDKVEPKQKYVIDRLGEAVTSFVREASIDLLPAVISGFARLMNRPPLIDRSFCKVSERYDWLMHPAVVAVERLIIARQSYALGDESLDVLHKFKSIRNWKDELAEIKDECSRLVPEWTELNRAALWYDVRINRRRIEGKAGERLTNFWQASVLGGFWKFGAPDFDYALEQISSRQAQDDKLVSLSIAHTIYAENGKPAVWRKRLKHSVSGNLELEQRLELFLNPPREHGEFRRDELRWKRKSAQQARRKAEQYEKSKSYILEHVEALRDPQLKSPSDISKAQWYLFEELRSKSEKTSNRWTEGRWRELTSVYGEEVAQAYRDGAVAYWRRYRPALRSEGTIPNTTPIFIVFGLTGLAIEANETPRWPESLSDKEVELATRYALHELNGFPVWFPSLVTSRSNIALPIIMGEVQYELSIEGGEQETNYILSDLSWSGEWAWDRLAPAILQIVKAREPSKTTNLQKLLKIIQGSAVVKDSELATVAKLKCGSSAPLQNLGQWYAVWVGVDPKEAIPHLTERLASLPSSEQQTAVSMNFVTHLWGVRRAETFGARTSFQEPIYIKELYLLMHKYIRRAEDIDRANGGVYSPELRDDAQNARDRLFNTLNSLPGKEAFLALREIAEAQTDRGLKSRILALSRQKAEREADMKPWSPEQVREFHEEQQRTPRDHQELAELAVLRLEDLKDDLENGDTSVANILLNVAEETLMRNFIADKLQTLSFGRYSVHQEEELADAKRPDIRFEGNGFNAPVPIELKLADKNWSGAELFERFEVQLAGDYLRDRKSARGIFALMTRGKKKKWRLPNSGDRVDFEGLVIALRNHWLAISKDWPGIDAIEVIGIDLTKRVS